MISYKDAIDELKARYHRNEVSALVGAGFSKNVYKEFPSWDELLHDMVVELYKTEIDDGFQQRLHTLPKLNMHYIEYCNLKVREIINREGYLEIVSKYLEHKGIREAVEIYIENRIPHVDEVKVALSLLNENREIKLNDSDFAAHTQLLAGGWDNIYTTNYDQLLEFAARRTGKTWNTIRKAQELSFSKQAKAIIKLHGDLCKPQDPIFEFDGNCHHRYVISKEDYINYPREHEAFTQLMRISLLQGTFCLFGFSGSDPNFISWIRWVRDILILHRNEAAATDHVKNIKIFLIDISAERPSADKQLFYNNHNIFHIPLLNHDVRAIIGAEKVTEPKELVIEFLKYIYNKEKQYSEIWDTVYSCKRPDISQFENVITIDPEVFKSLRRLKSTNRIVKTVRFQKQFLHDIYMNQELKEDIVDLLLLALYDTYLLPEYYRNLLENLESNHDKLTIRQQILLKMLKERSVTLKQPNLEIISETEDDTYAYEQVLRLAFRFDFSGLKQRLARWSPAGNYFIKKAVFMSLFDKEAAKELLIEYIDREPEIKERYYATSLLNLIDWQYPPRYSTVKYENQNIDGLYELKDAFVRPVTQKKEKLKPYGYCGKTYQIGNRNTDYENALRVLQFLIEFPVFTSFPPIIVINADDWYSVFRYIFEDFPYPTLFYSLQYSSSDLLTRVGQEYAYSDHLQKEIPDILIRLLKVYLDENTPRWLCGGIPQIAKELFVAVKPIIWEEPFLAIWDKEILPNYSRIESHQNLVKFICKGLQYIKSQRSLIKIITDCLVHEKQNIVITVEFLYSLRVTKRISATNLQEAISGFVANMDNVEEFTVAGNLYRLLSKDDMRAISIKVGEIIHSGDIDLPIHIFKALAYFTKKTAINQDIVKTAIINNRKLWDNGIHQTGASPADYIRLSELKHVEWTSEELTIIYEKLKESLNRMVVSNYYTDDSDFHFIPFEYDALLDEMLEFLVSYQKVLSKYSDYQELKQKISNDLARKIGFVNVEEALLSDDGGQIVKALNRMALDLIEKRCPNHDKALNLLVDRILFKKKEGLQSCLEFVVYYLKKYCAANDPSVDIVDKLLLTISLYNEHVLRELDVEIPDTVGNLVRIAEFLNKRGKVSPAINYWLGLKKRHRFNGL